MKSIKICDDSWIINMMNKDSAKTPYKYKRKFTGIGELENHFHHSNYFPN